MNTKSSIQKLLKEAEIYHRQGLLNEAKQNYKKATEIIRATPNIRGGKDLIDSIVKRVVALNQEINKINDATAKPLVSGKKQDLIKTLFASSSPKNDQDRLLDGAITLAKFGQYDRALREFEPLLEVPGLRVTAAKNIMRCLLELNDFEGVSGTHDRWCRDDRFTSSQMEKVRFFANQRLAKAGLPALSAPGLSSAGKDAATSRPSQPKDADPEPSAAPESHPLPIDPGELASEEDVLDIASIGIRFTEGALEGQTFELDVSFQSGNTLNLIVPEKESNLISHLEVGTRLEDIQFFSPIAILNGSGVVTSLGKIRSGPKEGNYSLDIAILK
ncbi:MAG: hypothetical protein ACOWWM_17775 [Desulfobacterales bacterium]